MSLSIIRPLLWNTNATDRKLNGQESISQIIGVSEHLPLSVKHWKECAIHANIWQRKDMERKVKIGLVAVGGTRKGWERWYYRNWTGSPETRDTRVTASALCPSGKLKGDSGSSSVSPRCPWVLRPPVSEFFFLCISVKVAESLYNLWTHIEPVYMHAGPPHHNDPPLIFFQVNRCTLILPARAPNTSFQQECLFIYLSTNTQSIIIYSTLHGIKVKGGVAW